MPKREGKIKTMLLLPALEEGGVERHVVTLARGLVDLGYAVTVVSSGGGMVSSLPAEVRHISMPIHEKNPFVGLRVAHRLAAIARAEGVRVLHAHSRVPAWAAYFARKLAPVRFVYTAHASYSLNFGLWPIKRADRVICVSEAVAAHLAGWLPEAGCVHVCYNALPHEVVPWRGSGEARARLLYLGRLSGKKGLGTLLEALARVPDEGWYLDVVGDGPERDGFEAAARGLGLGENVSFHGHRDDASLWISRCDLLLFPSRGEGMGLAVAEALAAGAPVLSSDLPAVREIASGAGFVPPGAVAAWSEAIARFLADRSAPLLVPAVRLPTRREMASAVADVYERAFS